MARRRANQQPTRVPTGGPRGQRQQLEAAQAAIPLPRSGGVASTPAPTPGGPSSAAGGSAAPMMPPDVFGPTGRPDEPVTAGAPAGPGPNGGMLPSDSLASFLRAVVIESGGDPNLMRMLERAVKRGI